MCELSWKMIMEPIFIIITAYTITQFRSLSGNPLVQIIIVDKWLSVYCVIKVSRIFDLLTCTSSFSIIYFNVSGMLVPTIRKYLSMETGAEVMGSRQRTSLAWLWSAESTPLVKERPLEFRFFLKEISSFIFNRHALLKSYDFILVGYGGWKFCRRT